MPFNKGERVEICNKTEGFLGSYYSATIVSPLGKYAYLVQHDDLLEDDKSGPLREIVPIEDVRPVPPHDLVNKMRFSMGDKVDAFDKDGWQRGIICGKKDSKYFVYFPCTGQEERFPITKLRLHVDWVQYGYWISETTKYKRKKKTPKKAQVVQETSTLPASVEDN